MNILRAFTVLLGFSFLFAPRAEAVDSTVGSSAITVALCAVGGAVLGASTLPFYEESSEHTKNIFYGAAIGAVAGVLIATYSGVKETSAYDEETTMLAPRPRSRLSANELHLDPEKTSALKGPALFADGAPKVWSPLVSAKF